MMYTKIGHAPPVVVNKGPPERLGGGAELRATVFVVVTHMELFG